jgi:hypothetical protein
VPKHLIASAWASWWASTAIRAESVSAVLEATGTGIGTDIHVVDRLGEAGRRRRAGVQRSVGSSRYILNVDVE